MGKPKWVKGDNRRTEKVLWMIEEQVKGYTVWEGARKGVGLDFGLLLGKREL